MVNLFLFFSAFPLLSAARLLESSALSNVNTSLSLLYHNNLNGTDDVNHIGVLLLDPTTYREAEESCANLGESPVLYKTFNDRGEDILRPLAYLAYLKDIKEAQTFWVKNGSMTVHAPRLATNPISNRDITYSAPTREGIPVNASYPVLCTQTSDSTQDTIAEHSKTINIPSRGNIYRGYRNKKVFTFQGIRYAYPPERFEYSKLYVGKEHSFDARTYGTKCTDSEDCLFLNIQTPFIPKIGETGRLRPVLFWIHGGAFVHGSSSEGYDGSNLAGKEDVVVVTINYRLSTLGFLSVPNSTVTGNYGISDQVTALDWVIQNIASFGGDPKRITIAGESAGAGAIRTLLGSPQAIGKFQGAIAMSNLGGGATLGLSSDEGTTYSAYLTPAESYAIAGQQIFKSAGCNQTSVNDQIDCLKKVDAARILSYDTVAKYVVQDGHYVNTPHLNVVGRNNNTAYVPVIFGHTADDGASFSIYPSKPVASQKEGIQAALDISEYNAQRIIDSGLFPYYDTGNVTLDSFNVSARVATDKTFRCIEQATVYAAAKTGAFPRAYFYQLDRTIDGFDRNKLGGPKNDDPNQPYFRLHGGDIPSLLGGMPRLRDANDLYYVQLTTAYFGAFIKTGRPTPDLRLQTLTEYDKVVEALVKTGEWVPVTDENGPIRKLNYPPSSSTFVDVPQCNWLNYTLNYYINGGR